MSQSGETYELSLVLVEESVVGGREFDFVFWGYVFGGLEN